MNIAVNGPHLRHANNLIEAALNRYWDEHGQSQENSTSFEDRTISDHILETAAKYLVE